MDAYTALHSLTTGSRRGLPTDLVILSGDLDLRVLETVKEASRFSAA